MSIRKWDEMSNLASVIERLPPWVDAIRAIAYREARENGADFITEEWVAKRVFRAKRWVVNNWNRSYTQVVNGDLWPPGPRNFHNVPKTESELHEQEQKKRRVEYMKLRPRHLSASPLSKLALTDRPMPFITCGPSGDFTVHQEAVDMLHAGDKPVCVVAIAGKYRTGKSFLMNRLYGSNSGFPLGGTVESKTKGIWIWQRQHPEYQDKTLVLLDTEGLYDPMKGDSTHDMKLFTLAILLSSCLVFNVTGNIDDVMIQQLHLVSKLTEHMKVKATRQEETGDHFSKYFPTFIMVVRDFFLELKIQAKSCTEDEYLEHTLKLKPGHSKEIKQYNQPRECIKDFFTRRKCFVLPKPIDDDLKLRELEKVAEEELKIDFLKKSDLVVKAILGETDTLQVEGDTITSPRFVELATEYVNALNSGQVPCIESAVTLLRAKECQKASEEALSVYDDVMWQKASARMPLELEDLSRQHRTAMEEATQVFRKKALFDEEGSYVSEFLNSVKAKYMDLVAQNESESTQVCEESLDVAFKHIKRHITNGTYMVEGGYEHYREDRDMAVTIYNSYPSQGPMAQSVLSDALTSMESTEYTILSSDKALTEASRRLEQEKSERSQQELAAQIQRDKNEALRIQLLDEQENNRRLLNDVKTDMENRLDQQARKHDQLVKQKETELSQMRREGNEAAEQLDRKLQKLRSEKDDIDNNRRQMDLEIQNMQAQNNNLLTEIRGIQASEASNQQRLQQLQQQIQQQQHRPKKRGGCVIQ